MADNGGATYRVGMIGVGRAGTRHARAFAVHPKTEVVAGVNRSNDTLDVFKERFGVPGYNDFEEMLKKERIDIACAVLPVRANAEVVIGCAKAGVKAIASEKPIAGTLQDLDRMVEECRSRGIPYAAGHVDRNYPQYWAARKMITDGELGDVRSINLYTNVVQGGCNSLTTMMMFAPGQAIRGTYGWDADVEWVVGMVSGDPFAEGDEGLDGMGGYLQWTNGIQGMVTFRPSAKRGVQVVCTKGVFESDNRTFRIWKTQETTEPPALNDLVEVQDAIPDIDDRDREQFDEDGWIRPGPRIEAHVQSVVDSLELGIEPRCSGADQLKAMEVSIAFRESHRRNHAPIRLPLEDRNHKMYPVPYRWNSKRDLYGDAWYRQEMKQHTLAAD